MNLSKIIELSRQIRLTTLAIQGREAALCISTATQEQREAWQRDIEARRVEVARMRVELEKVEEPK